MAWDGELEAGRAYDAFEVPMPFESEHNRRITWDHMLRQTSDWQGTLWGEPDWADRPQGDLVGGEPVTATSRERTGCTMTSG